MSSKRQNNSGHYRHIGREMALQFLFQNELREDSATPPVVEYFWQQIGDSYSEYDSRMLRRGRRYAEALIAGLNSRRSEVDAKISDISEHWDLDRMPVIDRNIVRIAVYEMMFEGKIPPIVSIDEAVRLALDFSDDKALSFINGILNRLKNELSRHPRHKDKKLSSEQKTNK